MENKDEKTELNKTPESEEVKEPSVEPVPEVTEPTAEPAQPVDCLLYTSPSPRD